MNLVVKRGGQRDGAGALVDGEEAVPVAARDAVPHIFACGERRRRADWVAGGARKEEHRWDGCKWRGKKRSLSVKEKKGSRLTEVGGRDGGAVRLLSGRGSKGGKVTLGKTQRLEECRWGRWRSTVTIGGGGGAAGSKRG